MATSSESAFLPFDASSSAWADVNPIQQDDGPSPLCSILYSPDYSQAMDLLRALLPADELSPRALALTEHLSQKCPSSYTAWHYRARILIHGTEHPAPNGLGSKHDRFVKELAYLDELAKVNLKNYQVWQHRKLIVLALDDPSRELAFSATVLDEDSKNYHTWVYRQWVLAHFGGLPQPSAEMSSSSTAGTSPQLWDGELDFVAKQLQVDARNNSAWNHRYFCLFGSRWAAATDAQQHVSATTAKRLCAETWKVGNTQAACIANEIAYAKDHIKMIPNNASAWTYLRGVCRVQGKMSARKGGNMYAAATDLARSLVAAQSKGSDALDGQLPPGGPTLALEWLLDDAGARVGGRDSEAVLTEAEDLVAKLCVADAIRKRFWLYRLSVIRKAVLV